MNSPIVTMTLVHYEIPHSTCSTKTMRESKLELGHSDRTLEASSIAAFSINHRFQSTTGELLRRVLALADVDVPQ